MVAIKVKIGQKNSQHPEVNKVLGTDGEFKRSFFVHIGCIVWGETWLFIAAKSRSHPLFSSCGSGF